MNSGSIKNTVNLHGSIVSLGARGYSNYEIAVQNGFEGSEQEWLDSLVGPVGPRGPIGPNNFHVGEEEPEDENVSVWLDTDEPIPNTFVPVATEETLGTIKPGNNLKVDKNGKLEMTIYANNVEEMVNSKLKPHDVVRTLGYYEPNDGGGALYLIREKTEDDVEDKGSIHFVGDSLVAELIVKDYVTPEMFGAYGNGVTDDTEKLQYLLDNYNNLKLSKKYKVSNINVNKPINIEINELIGDITIKNSNVKLDFNILKGSLITDDGNNLIQHCQVKGYKILNENGKGIYLNGVSKGTQYNYFEVKVIRADNCICFNKEGGWINNNLFKDMNLSYNIGINTLTTNTKYDANCFYNIGFEDINKWFNLNGFDNTIIDNPRMIPFEAHQTEVEEGTKLGTIDNSYNLTINGVSNGVWSNFIEVLSKNIIVINPLTNGGTRIGDKGVWDGTYYTKITQNNLKKPYLLLSEQSSNLNVELDKFDITQPIEIKLDVKKYLYININSSGYYKEYITKYALPYIDFKFIGSQESTIDIAYRNNVKHTVQANAVDDTFRYYFES